MEIKKRGDLQPSTLEGSPSCDGLTVVRKGKGDGRTELGPSPPEWSGFLVWKRMEDLVRQSLRQCLTSDRSNQSEIYDGLAQQGARLFSPLQEEKPSSFCPFGTLYRMLRFKILQ